LSHFGQILKNEHILIFSELAACPDS